METMLGDGGKWRDPGESEGDGGCEAELGRDEDDEEDTEEMLIDRDLMAVLRRQQQKDKAPASRHRPLQQQSDVGRAPPFRLPLLGPLAEEPLYYWLGSRSPDGHQQAHQRRRRHHVHPRHQHRTQLPPPSAQLLPASVATSGLERPDCGCLKTLSLSVPKLTAVFSRCRTSGT